MGRIVEIRDTPDGVKVELEHALEYVKRAVLGNDMWNAEIVDGVTLTAGWSFDISELSGVNVGNASPLVVVDGAPASINEIQSGRRTLDEICAAINQWAATERIAGRLYHYYNFTDDGSHARINYSIVGSGNGNMFLISMPADVWRMFGKFENASDPSTGVKQISQINLPVGAGTLISPEPALRFVTNVGNGPLDFVHEKGTFYPQSDASMPLPSDLHATVQNLTGDIGLVLVDGEQSWIVEKTGTQFTFVKPWFNTKTGAGLGPLDVTYDRTLDDPRGPIKVQQYFHTVMPFAKFLKCAFYSTSTNTPNNSWASEQAASQLAHLARTQPAEYQRLLRSLPPEELLPLIIHRDTHACPRERRPPLPPLVVNDAGRPAGSTRADCAPRAAAIGLGEPYASILAEYEALQSSPLYSQGYAPEVTAAILTRRGWQQTRPTWSATKHPHLADLPKRGPVIALTLNHVYCLLDGVRQDLAPDDPSVEPIQCIVSWWTPPEPAGKLTRQQRRAAARAAAKR